MVRVNCSQLPQPLELYAAPACLSALPRRLQPVRNEAQLDSP